MCERVCVCERVRKSKCVCVSVCVCEREGVRGRKREANMNKKCAKGDSGQE